MDERLFDMVEELLGYTHEKDGRETAMSMLEVGVKTSNLKTYAEVVARRFGTTPELIIEWYAETLNRTVTESAKMIEALTKERVKDE